MEAQKRLTHIDLLESIAIFFVVFYHSAFYNYDITQSGSTEKYLLYFTRTILSTGVPLFFFTNGYLLFQKAFSLKKHVRKIFRLAFLMIFWEALLMLLYMIIAGEPLSFEIIMKSILDLDVFWGMNRFWFLGALISIYILFPALKALFDMNRKAFVFFTAACAILTFGFKAGNQLLFFLSCIFHRNFGSLNYPLLTIFNPFRGTYGYAYVYFCVGGLIYPFENTIRDYSKSRRIFFSITGILISCILLFLVGVFHSRIEKQLWDVVWNGYDTVFTFFNAITIYILCLCCNRKSALIQHISANTLGIYFLHGLLVRLTYPWIEGKALSFSFFASLLYSLFITGGCLLICLCFRKNPVLKRLI